MTQTAKSYIDHLRPPGVKFMSIAAYNKKFGSNIEENRELEKAVEKARKEMGPNDFIVHNFLGRKRKLVQTTVVVPKEVPKAVPKAAEAPKLEVTEESPADELDDLLAEEMEPAVEAEYEEVCEDCKKADCKTDHKKDFMDKLEGMAIEDAKTLQHLIAFKGETEQIEARAMKGKARYMEKLKAYMNGDDTVEVRMYNGQRMKVAELKPNKESLRQLFESFPAGPHIVECD